MSPPQKMSITTPNGNIVSVFVVTILMTTEKKKKTFAYLSFFFIKFNDNSIYSNTKFNKTLLGFNYLMHNYRKKKLL